jgi:hypothetical protein
MALKIRSRIVPAVLNLVLYYYFHAIDWLNLRFTQLADDLTICFLPHIWEEKEREENMRAFTISPAVVLACVGGVLAGDMRIDFPLFMRAPAPAGTGTNLQVRLFSLAPSRNERWRENRHSRAPSAALQQIPYVSSHYIERRSWLKRGCWPNQITQTGNSKTPFAVDGSTFADLQTAGIRSCNNQHNECARTANASGDKSLTVGMCDQQQTQCVAAQTNSNVVVPGGSNGAEGTTRTAGASTTTTTTTTSAQPTLKSADADFFYFCDPWAAWIGMRGWKSEERN